MKNIIFSFGHSNRAFSEFLQKLKENKIEILIDARTFPRSRFSPQYNQKSLSENLEKENIEYIFKGKNLGGLGVNINYEETIEELVKMVKGGKRICVTCSEADFKKCHRYEMLTPSFEERGLKVEHIMYDKKI